MGWEAALGIGASLVGGLMGASSAKKAAKYAAQAELQAAQMQDRLARELFGVNIAMGAPYREGGFTALAGLMDMAGLSRAYTGLTQAELTAARYVPPAPDQFTGTADEWKALVGKWYENPASVTGGFTDYSRKGRPTVGWADYINRQLSEQQKKQPLSVPNLGAGSEILAGKPAYNWQMDPGYQFRQAEGMRLLESSAAARGGLLSGGFAKDVQTYGQNLASQEYGNIFNRLASIAGISTGQSGVGTATGAAAALGAGAAGSIASAGAARGTGYMAAGNAWQNSLEQIARLFGTRDQDVRGLWV